MNLFFRKFGAGFPLIILHGLYGSSDNWVTIGKALSKYFTVYLVDQRNHGQSAHDDAHNYDVMADDLHEFFVLQNISRAHILGHSMGGKTAMFFSLYYPDFVQKLIVVDIAPRAYLWDKISNEHLHILDALSGLNLDLANSLNELNTALMVLIPETRLRNFLLKNVTRNTTGNFEWKINLPVIRKELNSIFEGLDENCKIFVPTLFIKGELSTYLQVEDAAIIQKIFPHLNMQTVLNAGHWVHAEQPEEFMQITVNFLLKETT